MGADQHPVAGASEHAGELGAAPQPARCSCCAACVHPLNVSHADGVMSTVWRDATTRQEQRSFVPSRSAAPQTRCAVQPACASQLGHFTLQMRQTIRREHSGKKSVHGRVVY